MYLNYNVRKNIGIFLVSVLIFLVSIVTGLFLSDQYLNSAYRVDKNNLGTETADFSLSESVLYLSGTPDNDFNLLPNVFLLSLAEGTFTQVTGKESAGDIYMSYSRDSVTGNEFVLRPKGDIGAHTAFGPYILYPAINDSERQINNLQVNHGLFSSDLKVTSDSGRLAFVTHFPSNADMALADIPNLRDFSTWTIASLSAGTEDTSRYFENAIQPIWASSDHLVFLKEDAVYYHDFIANKTSIGVSAAELQFNGFTTNDRIAYISNSPEDMQLVLHKYDSNELFIFNVTQSQVNREEVSITLKNRFDVPADAQKITHMLGLQDDTIAVLQGAVGESDEYSKVVLYDISAGELQVLQTFSLEGVMQQGTATLDSWSINPF